MSRFIKLEPAEKKAVELLAKGLSTEKIAEEMKVKLVTSNNYLTKARRKIGAVDNHALLIMWRNDESVSRI